MSDTTYVSAKKPMAVTLGSFTLYCEHFFAERTRTFSEQNTSGGNIIFSNTGRKAMRITLKGRVYSEGLPASFLISVESLISGSDTVSFQYNGAVFNECRLLSFSYEDKGEDFIYASVTLITPEQAEAASESEDDNGEV